MKRSQMSVSLRWLLGDALTRRTLWWEGWTAGYWLSCEYGPSAIQCSDPNYTQAQSHPMRSPIAIVDVDRLDTWTRYRAGLCDTCAANCCTMPLEVQLSDLVRLRLVHPFEAEHEEIRHIAKRLQKARLIDHFNHKNAVFTMARRASGDCNFLDPTTRRCTVYDQRPETCRLHPQKKSPKPGYCAYGARARS